MEFGKTEKGLLKEIAGLEKVPLGAYNIRENGKLAGRNTTANIDIVTKKDKPGIDIYIKSDTKNERVDIPVILTETGLNDLVYNDFYVMTHGKQYAETNFHVALNGENSGAHVVSRSIAKDDSHQKYISLVDGNNKCSGHTECDAIIMDNGTVTAKPELNANNIDASLIHEAAIGKIAGEQLIKLMSLGLTEKEAEEKIVNGFLK